MLIGIEIELIFMKSSKKMFIAPILIGIILVLSSVIMAHAIGVTSTITVQQEPAGVAYDPAKGEIFVININAGTVSVISDNSNTVVATIPLGNPAPIGAASAIVYDSGKSELFVSLSGEVVIISDSNNTVISKIPVEGQLEGLAYDSAKGEIFVANTMANAVSVISDETDTVIASVTVPNGTLAIAYDSGKGEIFATNVPTPNHLNPYAVSSTISVISDNSNAVVANIKVGNSPEGIAYDSGRNEIFVTNLGSETVSVISDKSNTVIKTVPMGQYPYAIAYDSSQDELFVTCSNGTGLTDPLSVIGTFSVISDSSNTVIENVAIGGSGSSGSGLAYDSTKDEAFVPNAFLGTVSVISVDSGASSSPPPTVPEFSSMAFVSIVTLMIAVTLSSVVLAHKKSTQNRLIN
jgi:YVTN family beta-propeller protein